MNRQRDQFLAQHTSLARRYFLRQGAAGWMAMSALPLLAGDAVRDPRLQAAIDNIETWLTRPDDFQDVSRGEPKPHSLPEEKRAEVGQTRDTWSLEVVSDPEHPSRLGKQLTKADNTAFRFTDLMRLAETQAVRFPKIMTCLNLGCPLGNEIGRAHV